MQEKMIEDKFNAAVNVIRSLPKDGPYQPSHDMMLKFYGLYKQATEGPCKEPKPSFYEVVKGYKWRAWNALGAMSKTEAMNTYVEELKKIVETMSYSEDVAAFIEALGPFYEYVDILDLPNGKTSDGNHNITDKSSDSLPDNYEVITLCNGEIPPKINGIKKSLKDNSKPKDKSENGDSNVDDKSNENGLPSLKNNDHDLLAQKCSMMNGSEDGDTSASPTAARSEREARRIPVIPKIKPKRLTSDTDSDEEYSEPAESPELLQEKQKLRRNLNEKRKVDEVSVHKGQVDQPPSDNESTNSNSPVLEVVTCGGGDASQAGRIRLTRQPIRASHPYQSTIISDIPEAAPMGQAPPFDSEGGAGGGRRRRNSDDPHGDGHQGTISVNSQLILILQKIHQDLEAVVTRLDALETQALSQHQEVCALCQRRLGVPFRSTEKNAWWPFPELSPRSTFFLLTWPLILHGAVKLLLFLRSRRRRKATL